MTDPIPATPGWVDDRLDAIFANLPPETRPASAAFAECLAHSKAPAAPSDLLGAEFQTCHKILRQTLMKAGIAGAALIAIMDQVEALEAEVASDS